MVRNLPGLTVALALVLAGGGLMLAAWSGWADRFGWPVAAAALLLSAMAGFNAYAVLGALFFALDTLHWPWPQAGALALSGLLYVSPAIVRRWFGLLAGPE